MKENNKPRICECAWHCCVRVTKQAVALSNRGYKVHLITGMIPPVVNGYESIHNYSLGEWLRGTEAPERKQLINAIKQLDGYVDIFHVHNEPDWIVTTVGETIRRSKMVFDIHDLTSMRSKQEEPVERKAIEMADGLVTISEPYRDFIKNKYSITKPFEFVHSCVPEELYVKDPLPSLEGVVYEGGLHPVINQNQFLQYRNFARFLMFTKSKNVPFHIFPADPQFDYQWYRNNGAYLYQPKNYPVLMQELSRFDFGFAGTPIPNPEFDGAMPNKIFEYTAAGIPSMVFNAPAAAKFVEKEGLGVAIKNEDHFMEVYKNKDFYKKMVRKNMYRFTMEKEIVKLDKFYEALA
jgi:hypothetical protein